MEKIEIVDREMAVIFEIHDGIFLEILGLSQGLFNVKKLLF
jgi:hypothetical protein